MTPIIGLLAAGLILLTLGYCAWSYESPFGRCLACRISPGDHFCRRCHGTGKRLRPMWQLVNAFRRIDTDAHSGQHSGERRPYRNEDA